MKSHPVVRMVMRFQPAEAKKSEKYSKGGA
jgi:hypothetical protein